MVSFMIAIISFIINIITCIEYHCNEVSSCANTSIYCPINQDCIIKCNNQYSCQNAIIYAQKSRYLSITVEAQILNAANMKIYTPFPNYMKQKSIMTCYSDMTTNSNTLNHCNDISIYTTQGFEDIDLKCNDDSSLCDISGSIYCSHLNDECFSLILNDINYKYQCQNNEFCTTLSSLLSPSPTFSTIPILIPSSRPTIYQQKDDDKETFQVQNLNKEENIDTLYIVIIGSLAILCIVLSIAGLCGFCYIRMSRESVEETIVKRYIANRGRGASINNEIPQCINTNTTTNTITINETNTTTNITNNIGEDDDNFGSKESKIASLPNDDDIIYGDAASDNISSFDDDDLNKILDMDLNESPNGSEESSLGLGLTSTFPIVVVESNQNNDIIDFNIKQDGDDITSNPLTTENGPDSFSTSTYTEDTFDFEQEQLKIEKEMGLISAKHQHDYKIVYNTDNIKEYDHKCNLPIIPPPVKKLQLYLQTDVPLTDKQKEIQLENIKNRAKCYGYQQAQILFEDDENFSDDSDSHKSISSDCHKIKDLNISLSNSRSMGQRDPEILSDDEELPTLPANSP